MKGFIKIITCLLLVMIIVSCEDSKVGDEPLIPQTYDVQGKVEKGPFISGSTITMQPMNERLQVLGSMYSTAITDDIGNFAFGSKSLATPYAEMMANGYFFNEFKGELSHGTLTLRALVDLTDNSTVNVNVLTHLKYARIKKLVQDGADFEESNKQAQSELFNSFGLSDYVGKDASKFSIIAGTDESAVLIAISSLLLMDRSEAAFTEYLSKLSGDFAEKGCFSNEIKTQISADKHLLAQYLPEIKEGIINRYNNLGIDIIVKDLSRCIDWNDDGVAGNEVLKENEKVVLDESTFAVPNEGGVYEVKIESPIAVYLKPQVETHSAISPEINVSEEVFGEGLYEGYYDTLFENNEISCECYLEGNSTLTIHVANLQSVKDGSRDIKLYDYVGNVVAIVNLQQQGMVFDISNSDVPLLGVVAQQVVSGIACTMATGMQEYNFIEQCYNQNKDNNMISRYVSPSSSVISNAWNNIYKANSNLLSLKKADEIRLNVYADYCNVLSAVYYSTLVYGWDGVPYITDYSALEQIMNNGGIPRQSPQVIFSDIKKKLGDAIDNLSEKKNESIKDINGFFFVSKDVARVLLANIYMYEGNYSEAVPLLESVVNNGFYQLDASTNFRPSTTTESITVAESTEVIYALLGNNGSVTRSDLVYAEVMPYITLSDVYLSLAECQYHLTDKESADAYIDSVIDAKGLNVSSTEVLMRIKEVREQILLYSGTYFAFLKRSGLVKDVCGIEDYQFLLPIPEMEIYSNSYMTQNSGY